MPRLLFFSCGNCGSFFVHFWPMPPSFLFTRLSVVGLTTAVLSMPDSPWTTCFLAPIGLLLVFQNLTISCMCYVFRWLPISRCIEFRIMVWVRQCHIGSAQVYMWEFCCHTSGLVTHWNLCSAFRGELVLPFAYTSRTQHHAFSVVGPTTWNSLPLICVFS